jgi:hypothetical protein
MKDKILEIINNADLLDDECADEIAQLMADSVAYAAWYSSDVEKYRIVGLMYDMGFHESIAEKAIEKLDYKY